MPDDSQLPSDETTDEPADLEDTDLEDALDLREPRDETPPPDGPRTRDPRGGDDTRIPTPPVDDAEEPPADDVEECVSPDDGCCQSVIALVRRLELRGTRFTDEGRRGGGLIRSIVADSPDCFVGFVFADNMTCSLETGTCEPIDESR